MADPRKFLYDSDFPTPAFVAAWQGSFTVPAYDFLDPSFDHGLPFQPLIVGQWSLNANFEPSYDIATTNGYFVGVDWNQGVGSTASKIIFRLNNGYSTARTYYYRIFALAPSDYDGDIPSIEDSTNFRFNSDFNYPKLFAFAKYTETRTGTNDLVVNHNLGYIPQVRTWKQLTYEDYLTPFVNLHYEDSSAPSFGTIVDESKLTVKSLERGDVVYYQIYADEA